MKSGYADHPLDEAEFAPRLRSTVFAVTVGQSLRRGASVTVGQISAASPAHDRVRRGNNPDLASGRTPGIRPDPKADFSPDRVMAMDDTRERVRDLMQDGVTDLRVVIQRHKVPRELDRAGFRLPPRARVCSSPYLTHTELVLPMAPGKFPSKLGQAVQSHQFQRKPFRLTVCHGGAY